MPPKSLSKDKPYNDGQWTEARYTSFIKGGLRSISQRWPPRYTVLNEAFAGSFINPASGRVAKHYWCAACKGKFVLKQVQVNHREPVVPVTGFDSWDNLIKRLFCEKEGLEVLCVPCHKSITQQENKERKENR